MNARGQNTETKRIIACNYDDFVIRPHRSVEELEETVLRRFHRRDVAGQPIEGGTERADRFTKNPPVFSSTFPIIMFAFRLHMIGNPLIDGGEAVAHLGLGQREQVDDHDTARARRKVAAVAIRQDMLFQPRHLPQPQRRRLRRSDDEPGAMQYDPPITEPFICPQRHRGAEIGAHGQVGTDTSARLVQFNQRRVAVEAGFTPHPSQGAVARARHADGHGDANRRLVAGLEPRMVGHRQHQRQRLAVLEVLFHHAARKRLGDRIGGDKPEAPGLAEPYRFRRLVPEMHDEIGAARNMRAGLPTGFGIAVAQFVAHVLAADEGWVTDDEFRFRPFRRPGVEIAAHFDARGIVGHFFAGDRVQLPGHAVPAGDGAAMLVAQHVRFVIGDDGILFADIGEVLQHRLRRHGAAAGAEMPLQVADPQDQFGDGDGARVDFEAEKLVRIDGFESHLLFAEIDEGFQHLAFQPLHQFHRDIKEISRAAGRVKNPRGAKAVVEILHGGTRLFGVPRFHEMGGDDLDVLPVLRQRQDQRFRHKAFDIGPWRVMRAEGAAFARVERPFQQGAENRRFHILPVARGRDGQPVQFLLRQRDRRRVAEQPAVEMQNIGVQLRGESALVHVPPQAFQRDMNLSGLPLVGRQEVLEAARRQQADVLGEHGEQAAHQEKRDLFRDGVAVGGHLFGAALFRQGAHQAGFDGFRKLGQKGRDFPRHFSRPARRVEGARVGPDEAQTLADLFVSQIIEMNTEGLPIRELRVMLSLKRKVGVKLDHVPDIDHDDEGRPAFLRRQAAGIAFRLLAGVAHQRIPLGAAARAGTGPLQWKIEADLPQFRQLRVPLAALLGFEDEAAALVQVDIVGGIAAVFMAGNDAALENIGVVVLSLDRRFGLVHADQAAEFGQKQLIVRAFPATRGTPARDKARNRVVIVSCRQCGAPLPSKYRAGCRNFKANK